jgi:hypothetical protein
MSLCKIIKDSKKYYLIQFKFMIFESLTTEICHSYEIIDDFKILHKNV